MIDKFSGRVFRLANELRSKLCWYRDAFLLGMVSPEFDRAANLAFIKDFPTSWEIEETEFIDQPKRQPALLYRRLILTLVPAEQFIDQYFVGDASPPEGTNLFPGGTEPLPHAGRGTEQERRYSLGIVAEALEASGDPWFEVKYSYEHFGARVLLQIPGGFEESVWLISAGFGVDPRPALDAALALRAATIGGRVIAIDGPRPAEGTTRPTTRMIIIKTFREIAGGSSDFESRFITLDAWR